ncbi:MAG TPA: transcription termination/antitermination protein NusG, partial [Ruminococcus sp.]|nr:transcription termination/antitermination protein NusG [Ruminococcus sp.]
MSEAAKWYVIHTYSGYENKVAQNIEKVVENRKLHDLIQEVRVPTERVTEITDGKSKEIERKTYPGYVLVKMVVTDDSWYVVRNTRGCTGFVGPASEPTPLTDEEVESLFGVDVSTVEVNFSVGDRVQISGTAMDGFIGVVQNINLEERTVDLLV